jgi:hypothetical protein
MTPFLLAAALSFGKAPSPVTAITQGTSITVSTVVAASPEAAFEYIVPVPLQRIFKRQGRLPAVVRTDEAEHWFRPGLSRTVYFEDGSTAREHLLTVVPSESFSYAINGFSSQLRFLAKEIKGVWQFTPLSNGQTKIEWTYTIRPRSFIARGLIRSMVMKDLKALLTAALTTLQSDLAQQTSTLKNSNNDIPLQHE